MKKKIYSVFLVVALLLCAIPTSASAESVKISYNYSTGSSSTYTITIPSDVMIDERFGAGFGFTASAMNVVDGYRVVIRINPVSYDSNGTFSLYLDGNTSSPYKIPCTLKRSVPAGPNTEETINAGEAAIIAAFKGTDIIPYQWGNLMIVPGTGSVSGLYRNTLYYDISVEAQ